MYNKKLWIAFLFGAGLTVAALAADETKSVDEAKTAGTVGPERNLKLKPVLLEGSKSDGATLGLDYTYNRKWAASGSLDDSGADTFDFEKAWSTDRLVELRSKGTIATSRERNPNKMIDMALDARYEIKPAASWSFGAGASLKAETDQGLDQRQFGYALQTRTFVNNPIGHGWGLLFLNYGQVDPAKDDQRKKALGGGDLKRFDRWDAEAVLHHDLKGSVGGMKLDSIELQYRHFQEVAPSSAIRAAGLNRFRLGTVRVNLDDRMFVAYSRGRLPFDKQTDRTVKIGFSLKLD